MLREEVLTKEAALNLKSSKELLVICAVNSSEDYVLEFVRHFRATSEEHTNINFTVLSKEQLILFDLPFENHRAMGLFIFREGHLIFSRSYYLPLNLLDPIISFAQKINMKKWKEEQPHLNL